MRTPLFLALAALVCTGCVVPDGPLWVSVSTPHARPLLRPKLTIHEDGSLWCFVGQTSSTHKLRGDKLARAEAIVARMREHGASEVQDESGGVSLTLHVDGEELDLSHTVDGAPELVELERELFMLACKDAPDFDAPAE